MESSYECSGKILFDTGKRKVIYCEKCGYAHFYPKPTAEELDEFYKTHYSESTPSPNFKDKFETINEIFKDKNEKRILEIGAWDGEQLQYFIDSGWECIGIEPSSAKSKIAEARGIRIIEKMFQDVKDEELGKFDAVNLSFVLEHVPNPCEFLKRINENLLNKDGIICVEVPNDYSIMQEAVKHKYNTKDYWVSEPDHINYFNTESLKRFIEKNGFEIILSEASFPMEIFLLFGDNYLGNPDVGKLCHKKRIYFEESLESIGKNEIKRKLYQKMAELGIGRSILFFARKK